MNTHISKCFPSFRSFHSSLVSRAAEMRMRIVLLGFGASCIAGYMGEPVNPEKQCLFNKFLMLGLDASCIADYMRKLVQPDD